METMQFSVTGMSCGHCENAIRAELSEFANITEVAVSAASGELQVTGTELDAAAIIAAVDEAGYTATEA